MLAGAPRKGKRPADYPDDLSEELDKVGAAAVHTYGTNQKVVVVHSNDLSLHGVQEPDIEPDLNDPTICVQAVSEQYGTCISLAIKHLCSLDELP